MVYIFRSRLLWNTCQIAPRMRKMDSPEKFTSIVNNNFSQTKKNRRKKWKHIFWKFCFSRIELSFKFKNSILKFKWKSNNYAKNIFSKLFFQIQNYFSMIFCLRKNIVHYSVNFSGTHSRKNFQFFPSGYASVYKGSCPLNRRAKHTKNPQKNRPHLVRYSI